MAVEGDSLDSDSDSCAAPPFSPLASECDFNWSDVDWDEIEGEEDNVSDPEQEESSAWRMIHDSEAVEERGEREESMTAESQEKETEEAVEEPIVAIGSGWFGFKLVGDNVDRGTKATFQRAETHQNASFHYFHSYAVKDRIDLSMCSDVPSPIPVSVKAELLMPTSSEFTTIKKDFTVLLSRYEM